jgi:transposase
MTSKIDDYLAKGIDKRSIAKLLGVSPGTIYAWLKVRRPEGNPVVSGLP